MKTKLGYIEFGLRGEHALFTKPYSKQNGMPESYPVPTFGAIRGIAGDIYRHPTPFDFNWLITKIRVMNKISYETIGMTYVNNTCISSKTHEHENELVWTTYLNDVHYQVCGEILFADHKPPQYNLERENATVKAERIFCKRIFEPYKNLFLGRSECTAFPRLEEFGSGKGYYDDVDEIDLGNMFIQFDYLPNDKKRAYFANLKMKKGIIELPKKEDCRYMDFEGAW